MTASTTPSPTAPNEAMKRLRRRLRESLTPKSAAFAESLIDAALRTERLRVVEQIRDRIYNETTIASEDTFVFDGEPVVAILLDAVAGLSGEEPSDG